MIKPATLSEETPYTSLTPETVMGAVEALGYHCTGGLFALNSYENRVYDVSLDDGSHVVAKFYRPFRWAQAQIEEEHAFAAELAAAGVPVVAPLEFNGQTLFDWEGYMYTLYPKRGGRAFEVRTDEDLRQMGRLIARLHNVGAQGVFEQRLALDVKSYGWDNLVYLRTAGIIPPDLMTPLDATMTQLLTRLDDTWQAQPVSTLRLHGDCHLGNILVGPEGPFFVDLDDSLKGPAVQDLWMLTAGSRRELGHQFGLLVDGYEQFRNFDFNELRLVEVLRSLRMINYSAWLARRWNDPTFPKNFPFFNSAGYWQNLILSLKEQISLLDEPVLVSV